MKKVVLTIFFTATISISLFVFQSCKKDINNPPAEVHDLTFNMPGIEFKLKPG